MVKTLSKIGNSAGITLDKAVLEQLGVKEGDQVVLTVHDATLTIRAANVGMSPGERKASIKKFRAKYDSVLKRLAK